MKDKLDPDDVEAIEEALQDAKDWLDSNPDADKDEYED